MSIFVFFETDRLTGTSDVWYETVSEALQKPTGGYLRHILGAMTTNRFTGLLTGAFVTAFVQSSTATNGIFGRRRISFG